MSSLYVNFIDNVLSRDTVQNREEAYLGPYQTSVLEPFWGNIWCTFLLQ